MATVEAPTQPQIRLHQSSFSNEPLTDFSNEENARKIHQKANKEHVEPAMQAALSAFEHWSRTSVEERASLLFHVADLLRERKFEFAAWLVFEVSKNWAEADADIAETIDFCEYYAREALRLAKVKPDVQLPGEHDSLRYIPLGVGAVIPPWNFPCAIMAGMTVASIVTGNTVVLKPSSDSPLIAWRFFALLEAAGMPAGVAATWRATPSAVSAAAELPLTSCPEALGGKPSSSLNHPRTSCSIYTAA